MAVLASGEDTDNSDLQDLEKRKPHEPKRPLIDCTEKQALNRCSSPCLYSNSTNWLRVIIGTDIGPKRHCQKKFLGFTLVNGTIAIAHKALQTAMAKVKALTPRGPHKTLETNLKEINQWYVGWANYYSLTYYPPIKENWSSYTATITVKVGLPEKASLLLIGQAGCATKTSGQCRLFE